MTSGRMIELAAAVLLLGAAIWLYRRRTGAPPDGYGSQGAVLLLVIATIMAIHALGGLDYRPSASELDAARERSQ
jgi:hypothetical protein